MGMFLDEIAQGWQSGPFVSKRGSLWSLGSHRLLCGDARSESDLDGLMGSSRAAFAFLDVPYNVKVRSIGSRGRIKHAEFSFASGEMSSSEYGVFLTGTLSNAGRISTDGAVHFVCCDWRHVTDVMNAGSPAYGDTLNIVVWVKSNAGQGSFYRSQHEFIVVFRVGEAAHLNNIELGRHGRSRSNVWNYRGVNTFGTGRMDELRAHPTVKPVALVADAIRDCTRRRDLAAERVGRCAYAMEVDARYVDVAVRRWQAFTGKDAVDAESGLSFDELAERACAARELEDRPATNGNESDTNSAFKDNAPLEDPKKLMRRNIRRTNI